MVRPLEAPVHLFDYLAWDEASDEGHGTWADASTP